MEKPLIRSRVVHQLTLFYRPYEAKIEHPRGDASISFQTVEINFLVPKKLH